MEDLLSLLELLIMVDFIIMALVVMLVGEKVMDLLVVLNLVATFELVVDYSKQEELVMEGSMLEVGSKVKDFMVVSIAVELELELE
jgi:hypothetical protein